MNLESLMQDPAITDLVFNGKNAFALRRGVWVRSATEFDPAEVGRFAVELCAQGGRHIDFANPFADVAVDGFRIHAVLAAGVSAQPLLSIRRHSNRLVPLSDELQEIVHARENFLITGATGAGKTTLLRSMMANLDHRVITIEDVGELELRNPNYAALVARQANVEGRGAIGVEKLFREALRMRPDRIVLGEVRGAEFALLLQALNTGHAGSAATMHANGLVAVKSRLIGLGALAGLPSEATIHLAGTAIQKVIHVDTSGHTIAKLEDLLD